MHSAALIPLVAAAAATLVAGRDSSGTVTEIATSTRFLTVTQCHSAMPDCTAASLPTPGAQTSTPLTGPVSSETTSSEVPALPPASSWLASNSTGGAGGPAPSGIVTAKPSDQSSPTIPTGGANAVQPHTGVVGAAVAVAALLAAF